MSDLSRAQYVVCVLGKWGVDDPDPGTPATMLSSLYRSELWLAVPYPFRVMEAGMVASNALTRRRSLFYGTDAPEAPHFACVPGKDDGMAMAGAGAGAGAGKFGGGKKRRRGGLSLDAFGSEDEDGSGDDEAGSGEDEAGSDDEDELLSSDSELEAEAEESEEAGSAFPPSKPVPKKRRQSEAPPGGKTRKKQVVASSERDGDGAEGEAGGGSAGAGTVPSGARGSKHAMFRRDLTDAFVVTVMLARVTPEYTIPHLRELVNEFTGMFLLGAVSQVVEGPEWEALETWGLHGSRVPLLHSYWDYYNNYTGMLPFLTKGFVWVANHPEGTDLPQPKAPEAEGWQRKLQCRPSVRWAQLPLVYRNQPSAKSVANVPLDLSMSWWMTKYADATMLMNDKVPLAKQLRTGGSKYDAAPVLGVLMSHRLAPWRVDTTLQGYTSLDIATDDKFVILNTHSGVVEVMRDFYDSTGHISHRTLAIHVPVSVQGGGARHLTIELQKVGTAKPGLRLVSGGLDNSRVLDVLKTFLLWEAGKGRTYAYKGAAKRAGMAKDMDTCLVCIIGAVGWQTTYQTTDTVPAWQSKLYNDLTQGGATNMAACLWSRLFIVNFLLDTVPRLGQEVEVQVQGNEDAYGPGDEDAFVPEAGAGDEDAFVPEAKDEDEDAPVLLTELIKFVGKDRRLKAMVGGMRENDAALTRMRGFADPQKQTSIIKEFPDPDHQRLLRDFFDHWFGPVEAVGGAHADSGSETEQWAAESDGEEDGTFAAEGDGSNPEGMGRFGGMLEAMADGE